MLQKKPFDQLMFWYMAMESLGHYAVYTKVKTPVFTGVTMIMDIWTPFPTLIAVNCACSYPSSFMIGIQKLERIFWTFLDMPAFRRQDFGNYFSCCRSCTRIPRTASVDDAGEVCWNAVANARWKVDGVRVTGCAFVARDICACVS